MESGLKRFLFSISPSVLVSQRFQYFGEIYLLFTNQMLTKARGEERKAGRNVNSTQHSTQRADEQAIGRGFYPRVDSNCISTRCYSWCLWDLLHLARYNSRPLTWDTHRLRDSRFHGSEFHVSQ